MSKLPPIDQIKLSLPKLPPLSSPSKNKKSPKTKRVPTKDLNKVFVVIYIYLDDADEPDVKVFATKDVAIAYVENEIRKMEGQEDFAIDKNEEDMSWDVEGAHWEIREEIVRLDSQPYY